MTAQELKNSVLQLAVQGKLVPQCKDDEPASELLKHIRAEKQKLGIKEKSLPAISEDEIPFDIPESWEWARIGDIFKITMGQSPKGTSVSKNGTGLEFHQGKVYFGADYLEKSSQVTEEITKIAEPNSILLCVRAPVGIVNIVDREICIGRGLCAINSFGIMSERFILFFMRAFQNDFMKKSTGSTFKAITNEVVNNQLFPLPPLAEQKRIIAKIEELMPLIEEYGKAEEQLSKLNAEFPDKLRKSILQQAVQGKLTERDPDDEPASELLKRIKAGKEALIKAGKIKKEKPLPKITEDDKPFDIPDTWEWVRFKDIFLFENGDRSEKYPKDQDLVENGIPFWGAADMIDGVLRYSDSLRFISNEKFLELRSGKLLDGDFVCLLRGDVGKCAKFIAANGFSTAFINAQMIILRPVDSSISSFIELILKSEIFKKQIKEKKTGTAVAQMSAKDLQTFVIPLPPLSEQKRIVKRVEELLALCDELKYNPLGE